MLLSGSQAQVMRYKKESIALSFFFDYIRYNSTYQNDVNKPYPTLVKGMGRAMCFSLLNFINHYLFYFTLNPDIFKICIIELTLLMVSKYTSLSVICLNTESVEYVNSFLAR